MGPEYRMCSPLLTFAAINWNIPPATNSCDHSPAQPPGPPSISGFSPTTGAPGTSVTITGTDFGAGATVKVGGVVAAVTSASSTQLVITIPALGNSTCVVTVTTAAGTATSAGTFTVVVPHPLAGEVIKKIASGGDHACAILADDTVKCWGSNQLGQLGDGTTSPTAAARPVSGLANAIDIACGSSFSCAVVGAAPGDPAGAVRCWGNGTSGQLGDGAGTSASTPVVAGAMTTATQVTARAAHACALLANGRVMCWGEGGSGQLGDNTTSSSPVPVAVSGLGPDNYDVVNAQTGEAASTRAFEVSAGNSHTCARVSTSSGSAGLGVKCWGATNHGELGNGAPLCQVGVICDPKNPNPLPQRVIGITSAARLAAGANHACVILTGGSARCWGQGDQGQLGNGASLRSSSPVTVWGISGATHVSAGNVFSCASVAGSLKCWGGNDVGQLGNGTATSSPTPVAVTAIAASGYDPDTVRGGHVDTCLKRTDGTAFCFP